VEFETDGLLVQIVVWDHACCMDIVALSVATEVYEYNVAGACNGPSALHDRLDSFAAWLETRRTSSEAVVPTPG
jgi:hypothetical protein